MITWHSEIHWLQFESKENIADDRTLVISNRTVTSAYALEAEKRT